MIIRDAKISDAGEIYRLINYYAEHDKMLFRSLANIYENLQTFIVADDGGKILACCSLQICWSDLAEIKSIAVCEGNSSRGVGKALVEKSVQKARELGIQKVFALTLTPLFFEKQGFSVIDKDSLPMKVWQDCARCPKQMNCDETAVIFNL